MQEGSRENYKTTLQITCTKKETFKILNEKDLIQISVKM